MLTQSISNSMNDLGDASRGRFPAALQTMLGWLRGRERRLCQVAPAVVMLTASLFFWGRLPVLMLAPLTLPIVVVATITSTRLRDLLIGVTAFAVVLSLVMDDWTLRASFAISQPAFARAAERLEHGSVSEGPQWVGLVPVQRIEWDERRRAACFWVDLHPSGRSGFVLCEQPEPPFNLWDHSRLFDGWHFIIED